MVIKTIRTNKKIKTKKIQKTINIIKNKFIDNKVKVIFAVIIPYIIILGFTLYMLIVLAELYSKLCITDNYIYILHIVLLLFSIIFFIIISILYGHIIRKSKIIFFIIFVLLNVLIIGGYLFYLIELFLSNKNVDLNIPEEQFCLDKNNILYLIIILTFIFIMELTLYPYMIYNITKYQNYTKAIVEEIIQIE